MSGAQPLTKLEVATGLLIGASARPVAPAGRATPLEALEDAIRPALARPPCLVSFSGGRDSSAVLAAATALARREGLPLPIPATHRFAGADGTDETDWQEVVVAHLGLEDWLRLELSDELDSVGPVATRLLERHGLLWPCNLHFHAPLIDAAAGGSLLTGIGGDELFGTSRWWRAHEVFSGRSGPRPRDALALSLAIAPAAVRRVVLDRRSAALPFPWLRPDALDQLRAQFVADEAAEPFRWGASLRFRVSRRYLEVGTANLAALGRDADVRMEHPLLDAALVGILASLRRRDRFRTRTEGMQLLAGSLLPAAVLSRSSKARFDGAFWHRYSREFAERWDGTGVDGDIVDPERLREEWSSAAPDARTFTLLQSVWLAGTPRSARAEGPEEQLAGTVQ